MNQYNPTAPLREGFDFQDLWALKLCGEWLLSPEKYRFLRIEINPTEDNEFFLDDIGLLDAKEKYHLYQVKFKDNADYQWNWDDFLRKRKGKLEELPSLFGKWSDSLKKVGYPHVSKAVFVTNGALSDELKKFIINNKINIKKIKIENPDLYNCIKIEIGDDSFVKKFFKKFEFLFENNPKEDIEKFIREKIFYNDIRATKNGVDNLYLKLKREASKKHTIELSLKQIKLWCEFDDPKPLKEKFDIPSDFQFFNESTHKNILSDLKSLDGGIKIIFGKPGVGKSVYLSQLTDDLKKLGIIVIKHLYYISSEDNSRFERLNSDRVIEAIKAQFKSLDNKKYLGGLSNKNSSQISLKEFIFTFTKNLLKDNKNFVFILDGLDHVVREKDVYELKNFLNEIFFPNKGFWIVFGMQPQILNELTLRQIFNKCAKKDQIEIKGLNKKAVFKLVKKNRANLVFPDNKKIFQDIINKLYAISEGNPLYLCYVLTQLKNNFDNRPIIVYDCEHLIPFGGSIEKYYNSLWDELEEKIKTFLLIFISVDFQFTYSIFIECISSFFNLPTAISQSFKKVEHLISRNERDKLIIYHDSFRIFLKSCNEWKEQEYCIKKKIKIWLENCHYENLKWAELKKLEYELGNNKPVLKIDKKWLIDSIIFPRNFSQIESQLELCTEVAFKKNDFAKGFKINCLSNYYKNANSFVEDSARLINIESIKINPDFLSELFLKELDSSVLAEVADIANSKGKFLIINEIIEILTDRLDYQEYRVGEVPPATEAIIKVISYDRTHNVNRVYQYIIKFRNLQISHILFSLYAEKLLFLDQRSKLVDLLNHDFDKKERRVILESLIRNNLKNKNIESEEIIIAEKNKSILKQIYLLIQNKEIKTLSKLPKYEDLPDSIKEYGSEHEIWTENFYNYFFIGITYVLNNKSNRLESWIKLSPNHWSARAVSALFKASLKIGDSLKKENKINYENIFYELKDLPDLLWPEDRDLLKFKVALKSALKRILKDVFLIKIFLNDSIKINDSMYNEIISTPFFIQNDLFDLALDLDVIVLEKNVYNLIFNEKINVLENSVNGFPERSMEYANLARLSELYQENEKVKDLLEKATENFLGYGYHKDPYLFELLEAIEFCTEANIEESIKDNWIQRIIPLITNIKDYTDGDETNHLPNYLADYLSKCKKDLLFKFYFDQANKEELYPSQDLFKYIIRSLVFIDDIEVSLATTALDNDSFFELKEKARVSEAAQLTIDNIQKYLGSINYKEKEYSNTSSFSDEEVDYSKVSPEQLEVYLSEKKNKWDFDKYLIGWTNYWLDKIERQKTYNLIKPIILGNSDINSISGELLDMLYPLAYEFDNDEAFKLLCLAQKKDYGWNKYWTHEKAKKRWGFLKEKYPQRYLEFFKASMHDGFILSRTVEFFIFFNAINIAIIITDASIGFAESLMADMNLIFPEWAKNDYREIDELDIIFQRLVWPSPLVRERAAIVIGNLLAFSNRNVETYNRFIDWIRSWKIESIIAIGLLPIIKAFQICEKRANLSFIKVQNIIDAIQTNSIVIEKLLEEISSFTNEKIVKFPNYSTTKELPNFYETSKFFNKYIKTILAPIYFYRAEKIEKSTNIPFIKLWDYNTNIVAKEEDIEFNSNHDFYGYNENGKFLTGFSTKVSEIYRSTFLRILYSLYKNNLISMNSYFKYAFATLPIDLSYWDIIPNRIPLWWPKLISFNADFDVKKISTIQFKEPIENILQHREGDKIIIAAEGAIEPKEGWADNPVHSFSLISFGYKVLGKGLPKAEEVAQEIIYMPQTIINTNSDNDPINFLKNSLINNYCSPYQVKDLIIYPIITRNMDLTISLWQYFRDKNQSFNINEELHTGLKSVLSKHEWCYLNGNNEKIVVFKDWLEGLQERYEFEMPIPHGHYVLIDNKFLIEKLKKMNLRVGYILHTTYRYLKNYDKIQKLENSEFVNVFSIITI